MLNTNMQTQTSNALHNVIMEVGGKDRPPMLAPVPVAEGSSKTTTERYMENYKNVSQDIRDQLNAEAEAVQIILTGIDNDIYSTVDACPNACEMWKAIERLKQGESINVQDLETNLYWEFGKFTSRDGESLESYYSRFVTLVKQSQELKTVSYHKLYDILKQHQNEVNEIRAERLARTANPLALVSQQQPAYHPQNHPNHNSQYSSTRSQQATKNRGKAIVNSSAPTYDQEPTMVTEDDEMSKEKEIDKLMALISLSFKKIYKPANNNLRTSSSTTRANQDNSPRINRGIGYENQRAVNVADAREKCRECQKPKRAKDATYHKEKMLLCKQEEAGVQLNADQADWKDDTDDESNDKEFEAHYMYMAQIQEVTPDTVDNSGPIFDAEPLHKVHNNNDNYNVFAIENEHPEQPESVNDIYLEEQERDLLASLIKKLKCEIYDSKNRNKLLETSNKALVDKLKDLKKFQAKLDKYHDVNYASNVKIDCAKAKGDLLSYKIESENFAKPEFLKNPHLYDIGCYNDNLALMITPESDRMIHLAKEGQLKFSDLIRPFDYDQLNNLYDLFVPQREKSPEQYYFSKTSKMSHTSSNNEISKGLS
ncbi:hypothetical protein Tco_1102469 [Tanacetum coccineum]